MDDFYTHSRRYVMRQGVDPSAEPKSIEEQCKKLAVRTRRDCGVLFPAHVSLQEIEMFKHHNPDFMSPWETPAGKFLLRTWAGKNEFSITWETFYRMRKKLLERFADNVEGNLTILDPRPHIEPKYSIFYDFMLPILEKNPRLIMINGEYKDDFIEDYNNCVNKCRSRGRHEPARIYRIK